MLNEIISTTRFLETIDTKLTSLSPIKLKDIELVSFFDAVEPIKELVEDLDEYTFISWDFAQNNGPWTNELTDDEVAAINLYTREWTVPTKSLYFILNKMLRDPNRRNIEPFFKYMKLLYNGIYKCDNHNSNDQRIWRAIKLSEENLSKLDKDQKIRWWAFSSCTTSMSQLEQFTNEYPVLFSIQTSKSFSISSFSCHINEAEVLIVPPVQFIIKNKVTLRGVTIIELSEDTSFPLNYLPFPKRDNNYQLLNNKTLKILIKMKKI